MITVNILYPNQEGAQFDLDYYLNTHMPMTIQSLGEAMKGVRVEHGLTGGLPDAPPAYLAMCHLLFDSAEAFFAAFAPHAEILQGDIPNYTNVKPVIQLSEVKIFR